MKMVKISVFGDICPLKLENPFNIELSQSDFVLGNLECPLTDHPKQIKKAGPVLYASEAFAKVLKDVGFYAVNLANNHIRDCGEKGVVTTISSCARNGILTFGAGETHDIATRPLIVEKHGLRVGIISFAEKEFNYSTKGLAGAAVFDPYDSFEMISSLKDDVDVVIVLYHGGIENYVYPSPLLQKKCRKMVDSGADVVLCQHSHCIGTRENYKGGEILYGQGNSVFGYRRGNDTWNYGLLVNIVISASKGVSLSYDVLETNEDGTVHLASEIVQQNILNLFDRNSTKLSDQKFLTQQWEKFCERKESLYLPMLLGFGKNLNRLNRLLRNLLVKLFFSRRKLNVIHNIIRCDAHEEVITTILEKYDF